MIATIVLYIGLISGFIVFIVGLCTMPTDATYIVTNSDNANDAIIEQRMRVIHSNGFLIAMIGLGIILSVFVMICMMNTITHCRNMRIVPEIKPPEPPESILPEVKPNEIQGRIPAKNPGAHVDFIV